MADELEEQIKLLREIKQSLDQKRATYDAKQSARSNEPEPLSPSSPGQQPTPPASTDSVDELAKLFAPNNQRSANQPLQKAPWVKDVFTTWSAHRAEKSKAKLALKEEESRTRQNTELLRLEAQKISQEREENAKKLLIDSENVRLTHETDLAKFKDKTQKTLDAVKEQLFSVREDERSASKRYEEERAIRQKLEERLSQTTSQLADLTAKEKHRASFEREQQELLKKLEASQQHLTALATKKAELEAKLKTLQQSQSRGSSDSEKSFFSKAVAKALDPLKQSMHSLEESASAKQAEQVQRLLSIDETMRKSEKQIALTLDEHGKQLTRYADRLLATEKGIGTLTVGLQKQLNQHSLTITKELSRRFSKELQAHAQTGRWEVISQWLATRRKEADINMKKLSSKANERQLWQNVRSLFAAFEKRLQQSERSRAEEAKTERCQLKELIDRQRKETANLDASWKKHYLDMNIQHRRSVSILEDGARHERRASERIEKLAITLTRNHQRCLEDQLSRFEKKAAEQTRTHLQKLEREQRQQQDIFKVAEKFRAQADATKPLLTLHGKYESLQLAQARKVEDITKSFIASLRASQEESLIHTSALSKQFSTTISAFKTQQEKLLTSQNKDFRDTISQISSNNSSQLNQVTAKFTNAVQTATVSFAKQLERMQERASTKEHTLLRQIRKQQSELQDLSQQLAESQQDAKQSKLNHKLHLDQEQTRREVLLLEKEKQIEEQRHIAKKETQKNKLTLQKEREAQRLAHRSKMLQRLLSFLIGWKQSKLQKKELAAKKQDLEQQHDLKKSELLRQGALKKQQILQDQLHQHQSLIQAQVVKDKEIAVKKQELLQDLTLKKQELLQNQMHQKRTLLQAQELKTKEIVHRSDLAALSAKLEYAKAEQEASVEISKAKEHQRTLRFKAFYSLIDRLKNRKEKHAVLEQKFKALTAEERVRAQQKMQETTERMFSSLKDHQQKLSDLSAKHTERLVSFIEEQKVWFAGNQKEHSKTEQERLEFLAKLQVHMTRTIESSFLTYHKDLAKLSSASRDDFKRFDAQQITLLSKEQEKSKAAFKEAQDLFSDTIKHVTHDHASILRESERRSLQQLNRLEQRLRAAQEKPHRLYERLFHLQKRSEDRFEDISASTLSFFKNLSDEAKHDNLLSQKMILASSERLAREFSARVTRDRASADSTAKKLGMEFAKKTASLVAENQKMANHLNAQARLQQLNTNKLWFGRYSHLEESRRREHERSEKLLGEKQHEIISLIKETEAQKRESIATNMKLLEVHAKRKEHDLIAQQSKELGFQKRMAEIKEQKMNLRKSLFKSLFESYLRAKERRERLKQSKRQERLASQLVAQRIAQQSELRDAVRNERVNAQVQLLRNEKDQKHQQQIGALALQRESEATKRLSIAEETKARMVQHELSTNVAIEQESLRVKKSIVMEQERQKTLREKAKQLFAFKRDVANERESTKHSERMHTTIRTWLLERAKIWQSRISLLKEKNSSTLAKKVFLEHQQVLAERLKKKLEARHVLRLSRLYAIATRQNSSLTKKLEHQLEATLHSSERSTEQTNRIIESSLSRFVQTLTGSLFTFTNKNDDRRTLADKSHADVEREKSRFLHEREEDKLRNHLAIEQEKIHLKELQVLRANALSEKKADAHAAYLQSKQQSQTKITRSRLWTGFFSHWISKRVEVRRIQVNAELSRKNGQISSTQREVHQLQMQIGAIHKSLYQPLFQIQKTMADMPVMLSESFASLSTASDQTIRDLTKTFGQTFEHAQIAQEKALRRQNDQFFAHTSKQLGTLLHTLESKSAEVRHLLKEKQKLILKHQHLDSEKKIQEMQIKATIEREKQTYNHELQLVNEEHKHEIHKETAKVRQLELKYNALSRNREQDHEHRQESLKSKQHLREMIVSAIMKKWFSPDLRQRKLELKLDLAREHQNHIRKIHEERLRLLELEHDLKLSREKMVADQKVHNKEAHLREQSKRHELLLSQKRGELAARERRLKIELNERMHRIKYQFGQDRAILKERVFLARQKEQVLAGNKSAVKEKKFVLQFIGPLRTAVTASSQRLREVSGLLHKRIPQLVMELSRNTDRKLAQYQDYTNRVLAAKDKQLQKYNTRAPSFFSQLLIELRNSQKKRHDRRIEQVRQARDIRNHQNHIKMEEAKARRLIAAEENREEYIGRQQDLAIDKLEHKRIIDHAATEEQIKLNAAKSQLERERIVQSQRIMAAERPLFFERIIRRMADVRRMRRAMRDEKRMQQELLREKRREMDFSIREREVKLHQIKEDNRNRRSQEQLHDHILARQKQAELELAIEKSRLGLKVEKREMRAAAKRLKKELRIQLKTNDNNQKIAYLRQQQEIKREEKLRIFYARKLRYSEEEQKTAHSVRNALLGRCSLIKAKFDSRIKFLKTKMKLSQERIQAKLAAKRLDIESRRKSEIDYLRAKIEVAQQKEHACRESSLRAICDKKLAAAQRIREEHEHELSQQKVKLERSSTKIKLKIERIAAKRAVALKEQETRVALEQLHVKKELELERMRQNTIVAREKTILAKEQFPLRIAEFEKQLAYRSTQETKQFAKSLLSTSDALNKRHTKDTQVIERMKSKSHIFHLIVAYIKARHEAKLEKKVRTLAIEQAKQQIESRERIELERLRQKTALAGERIPERLLRLEQRLTSLNSKRMDSISHTYAQKLAAVQAENTENRLVISRLKNKTSIFSRILLSLAERRTARVEAKIRLMREKREHALLVAKEKFEAVRDHERSKQESLLYREKIRAELITLRRQLPLVDSVNRGHYAFQAKQIKRIQGLIQDCFKYLGKKKVTKAKETYLHLRTIYASLEPDKKALVYESCERLYRLLRE